MNLLQQASAASVVVVDLVKRFGEFTAVDGVSFQVYQGEIFGFLGSNGAGKTTTIRMLCGLLKPDRGKATILGLDVYSQAERIKQRIGYMSQRFSLYDELSVEENIRFFSGIYGVTGTRRERRLEEVLARLGLGERRRMKTALLSGGWKQRLALGCAILHEPEILFLDEPTSGVDPIARRNFWDLIYQLSGEGRTIFVTTHYLMEAEYCHRLALMESGRIIALDSPSALRKAQTDGRLMRLECRDPVAALRLLAHSPMVRKASVFGAGLQLRVVDPEDAARGIPALLQENGIAVEGLRSIHPTMEDVFVTLIEEQEKQRK